MFLGHFAVALSARKIVPRTSLGLLLLGAQLADILWPTFLLFGWERVQIVPGITRISPFDFVSYPYSHSLLAELLWAAALGAIYYAIRRDVRSAIILGACVPTHWLLDFISHRPDMPIFPGSAVYGLGLWNHPAATIFAEGALFCARLTAYVLAFRLQDYIHVYAFWCLMVLLFVLYLGSVFGPPPPDTKTLTVSALAIWLTVPWAAWADYGSRPRSLAIAAD
jgi:hypothetical protein